MKAQRFYLQYRRFTLDGTKEDIFVETNGYPLEIESLPGIKLFVYRHRPRLWKVCEISTGMVFGWAEAGSKDKAVMRAREVAERMGLRKARRAIKQAISLGITSPIYLQEHNLPLGSVKVVTPEEVPDLGINQGGKKHV